MQDMEIQNGAQLTVRESQMAVFVNEGVFADIFFTRPLHAEHEDAPAAHQPAELGQALSVAVQVRRVFLLHPPADEPAVGHADADHDSRQGFRHRSAARMGSTRITSATRLSSIKKSRRRQDRYTTAELEPHLRNTIIGKVSDAFARAACRSSTWPRTLKNSPRPCASK
jgi:hypothetical protein